MKLPCDGGLCSSRPGRPGGTRSSRRAPCSACASGRTFRRASRVWNHLDHDGLIHAAARRLRRRDATERARRVLVRLDDLALLRRKPWASCSVSAAGVCAVGAVAAGFFFAACWVSGSFLLRLLRGCCLLGRSGAFFGATASATAGPSRGLRDRLLFGDDRALLGRGGAVLRLSWRTVLMRAISRRCLRSEARCRRGGSVKFLNRASKVLADGLLELVEVFHRALVQVLGFHAITSPRWRKR